MSESLEGEAAGGVGRGAGGCTLSFRSPLLMFQNEKEEEKEEENEIKFGIKCNA